MHYYILGSTFSHRFLDLKFHLSFLEHLLAYHKLTESDMTGPKFFRLVRIRNLLKGWMTKVWSGLSHDLAFCYFFHGGRSMFWICCCCTVKGFGTWCTATTEAISRAYTAFWTWSSPTVGPYTTTLSTTFVLLSVPCRRHYTKMDRKILLTTKKTLYDKNKIE